MSILEFVRDCTDEEGFNLSVLGRMSLRDSDYVALAIIDEMIAEDPEITFKKFVENMSNGKYAHSIDDKVIEDIKFWIILLTSTSQV